MAAIDEIQVSYLNAAQSDNEWRLLIGNMFWNWYRKNTDVKVKTVRLWFFSKTLYVRDLHPVFELLFGPES